MHKFPGLEAHVYLVKSQTEFFWGLKIEGLGHGSCAVSCVATTEPGRHELPCLLSVGPHVILHGPLIHTQLKYQEQYLMWSILHPILTSVRSAVCIGLYTSGYDPIISALLCLLISNSRFASSKAKDCKSLWKQRIVSESAFGLKRNP